MIENANATRELEHVAPRPAPDDDRRAATSDAPRSDRGQDRQPDRRPRERARRRGQRSGAGRGRARPGSSRTSRSRRPRRPAGGRAPRAGECAGVRCEHHRVPDVGREPERHEDDAEREEARTRARPWSSSQETPDRGHGLRRALRRPPRRRASGRRRTAQDDRARLDLQDEAAVGAGVDDGRAAEAAHRADDRELVVAALAADRARRDRPGASRRQWGRPGGKIGWPSSPISATRGPSSKCTPFTRGLRTW